MSGFRTSDFWMYVSFLENCRCLIMLKSFELAKKYFFFIKQDFPLGCIDGFTNFNELQLFEE